MAYRYYETGFEGEPSLSIMGNYYTDASGIMSISSVNPHTGNKSMRINATGETQTCRVAWSTIYQENYRVGFWLKPSTIYGSKTETQVCRFSDRYGYRRFLLLYNESGEFTLYNYVQGYIATVGGYPPGDWVRVGISGAVHPTTGVAHLWLNGRKVIDFNGNTGGTNYDIGAIYLGNYQNDSERNQGPFTDAYFDDFYFDSMPGETEWACPPDDRFLGILPDGDVTVQWGTKAANNYSNLLDYNTGKIIKAWNVDQKDIYSLSNITLPTNMTIYAVRSSFYARTVSVSNAQMEHGWRYGATEDVISEVITTSPTKEEGTLDTLNPQGLPWTESNLNDTQLVYKATYFA